jgi:hypothetical protein
MSRREPLAAIGAAVLLLAFFATPRHSHALFIPGVNLGPIDRAIDSGLDAARSFGNTIASQSTSAWNRVRTSGVGTVLKDIASKAWQAIKAGVYLAVDNLRLLLDIGWTFIKQHAASAWRLLTSQPCDRVFDLAFAAGGVDTNGINAGRCGREIVKGFVCSMPNFVTDVPKYAEQFARAGWEHRGACLPAAALGGLGGFGGGALVGFMACGLGYWIADRLPGLGRCMTRVWDVLRGKGGGDPQSAALMKEAAFELGCNLIGSTMLDTFIALVTGGANLGAAMTKWSGTFQSIADKASKLAKFRELAKYRMALKAADFGANTCGAESTIAVQSAPPSEIYGLSEPCLRRPSRISGWTRVNAPPAKAVAITSDATLWLVGTDGRLRRSKRSGQASSEAYPVIPGVDSRVRVAANTSRACAVARNGTFMCGVGGDFKPAGAFKQVTLAADGTGYGLTPAGGLFKAGASGDYRPTGGGPFTHISAGSEHRVFAIDRSGQLFRSVGDGWQLVAAPMPMKQVSVGADGTVIAIDAVGLAWFYDGCAFSPLRMLDAVHVANQSLIVGLSGTRIVRAKVAPLPAKPRGTTAGHYLSKRWACKNPVGYGIVNMQAKDCRTMGGLMNGRPHDTVWTDCHLHFCPGTGPDRYVAAGSKQCRTKVGYGIVRMTGRDCRNIGGGMNGHPATDEWTACHLDWCRAAPHQEGLVAARGGTCERAGYGIVRMAARDCRAMGGALNGTPPESDWIDCHLDWCTASTPVSATPAPPGAEDAEGPDDPTASGQLDGWRWCHRCQALTFGQGTAEKSCPAGGKHEIALGGTYSVVVAGASLGGQPGWRHCEKCNAAAYAPSTKQTCAAGGAHDVSKSAAYWMRMGNPATGNQGGWKWCRKCSVLVHRGAPGRCAAGGGHDHGDGTSYFLTVR